MYYYWFIIIKQIAALKEELENFFGKDPIESKDTSRIVSPTQFARLIKLLDEDKASDKIVLGGQRDEKKLWVCIPILVIKIGINHL
jgi:aldehyde dehydrogenase (NAD+)